ncbi:hypothetical protein PG989_005671 [Apiospora arundinis]
MEFGEGGTSNPIVKHDPAQESLTLPPLCQQNTPAPPTPVQLPGRYKPQNHGYGPHAPSPEKQYPAPAAIATAKRKAQRASQACDSCRQLKAKCDELKPCKTCKEKGIQCNYREPPAKQQVPNGEFTYNILNFMQSLKAQMSSLDNRMEEMCKLMDINYMRLGNKIDKALTTASSENIKMESVEDKGANNQTIFNQITSNQRFQLIQPIKPGPPLVSVNQT